MCFTTVPATMRHPFRQPTCCSAKPLPIDAARRLSPAPHPTSCRGGAMAGRQPERLATIPPAGGSSACRCGSISELDIGLHRGGVGDLPPAGRHVASSPPRPRKLAFSGFMELRRPCRQRFRRCCKRRRQLPALLKRMAAIDLLPRAPQLAEHRSRSTAQAARLCTGTGNRPSATTPAPPAETGRFRPAGAGSLQPAAFIATRY